MLTKNGKKRYKKFQDSDDVADKRQKKESDESSGTTSTESEVFRTDLIKSMRTDIALAGGCAELIPIQDKWKEEWNHGVQVCVNESVEPAVPVEKVYWPYPEDYVFPGKNILCHPTSSCLDESKCIQSPVPKRMYYSGGADDQHWLELINDMRQPKKLPRITLEMLYDVLNALEFYCYQNTHFELLQPVQRNEEEDAVCDICRSADSYAEDEIVFCDGCNLSVHQICYGLLSIPTHDWLCTCCALRYGKKTPCVLCPNLGGAMKCTADGALWAHVSCALWMPEVKFGDIDHREPICGISDIRRERLQLRCSICDLREGACIQCTIDKCKTAFHVVCGHRANLILKMEDDDIDEVKKTALCLKHTKAAELSSEDNLAEPVASTSAASDNTVLKEIEKYFPLYVNIEKITQELQLDPDVVKDIYALWLCKRKENNHRPIIKEPVGIDLAENLRAISNPSTLDEKIDRIIAQRGNMERARNLCYQIGQREKKKRSLVHSRVDIFEKTMEMMTKPTIPVNMRVLTKMKIFKNSNVVETKPIETKPIETKPIETKPIETKTY